MATGKVLAQPVGTATPQLSIRCAARASVPFSLRDTSWSASSSTPEVARLSSAIPSLQEPHVLGVPGFIGKVWLWTCLKNSGTSRKVSRCSSPQSTTSAQRRFEKIVEERPPLDGCRKFHGANLAAFSAKKIEVVEGDVSQPGWTGHRTQHASSARSSQSANTQALPIQSRLRDALSSNVDSTRSPSRFPRKCDTPA